MANFKDSIYFGGLIAAVTTIICIMQEGAVGWSAVLWSFAGWVVAAVTEGIRQLLDSDRFSTPKLLGAFIGAAVITVTCILGVWFHSGSAS